MAESNAVRGLLLELSDTLKSKADELSKKEDTGGTGEISLKLPFLTKPIKLPYDLYHRSFGQSEEVGEANQSHIQRWPRHLCDG